MLKIFPVALLAWGAALGARGADGALEALPPPELPAPVQSGEALAPGVTAREEEGGTVREYRIEGRLYMIKVAPAAGVPYYMVDYDGDGSMETNVSTVRDEDVSIPQWLIYSW